MVSLNTAFFGRPIQQAFVVLYKEAIELEGKKPQWLRGLFNELLLENEDLLDDSLVESCLIERNISFMLISSSDGVGVSLMDMRDVAERSDIYPKLCYSLTKAYVTFFNIIDRRSYESFSTMEKELEKAKQLLEEIPREGTFFAGRYQILKGLLQNEYHLFAEAMQSFEIGETIFNRLNVPYQAISALALRLHVLSHRNPEQFAMLYARNVAALEAYPIIEYRMRQDWVEVCHTMKKKQLPEEEASRWNRNHISAIMELSRIQRIVLLKFPTMVRN